MKTKNKIIKLSLLTLLGINSYALNIDEALAISLKNNLDVKVKQYSYEESLEKVSQNNSGYLPKLDLLYNYSNSDQDTLTNKGTLAAVVSYNLFNGFKTSSSKEASQLLSNSSKYSLLALKADIVLNTKKAYIKYLNNKNILETYESGYLLFKEQFNDSKNKFDQGLLSKNDLLQVQVNMSNAKQNVVKANGNLKVSKYELSNILGGYDLKDEVISELKENTLPSIKFSRSDLENRSEIRALKENIAAINQSKKASVNSTFYPKVDLSLTHYEYFEDESFNRDASTNDNEEIASVNVSWNLFNGGSNYTMGNIYKKQMLKEKSLLEKTILDIKLQFEKAKSDFVVARDNLETNKLALEQASENYKIVKNRFNVGISSSTDLTNANYLLTSVKQNYHKAYFDKFLAFATIKRILEQE